MWALRDQLGEALVDQVLRDFAIRWHYRGPPYPTTEMPVADLRATVPPDKLWLIEDLFETITLYENKATAATVVELPNGRFEVTLTVDVAKVRADSEGRDTPLPVQGTLDIGVFATDEDDAEPPHLAKHPMVDGERQIVVVVDELPAKAGIDPYYKLIDRHLDDNMVAVEASDGARGATCWRRPRGDRRRLHQVHVRCHPRPPTTTGDSVQRQIS
jgi:ABC-2 type transport system permease protein